MIPRLQETEISNATEHPLILIIEDSPDLCEVLQAQLEFHGLSVVCVEDGFAALNWLDHHQADLIILDLMLPGMDGTNVCQLIRRKHSPSVLPILMLSALGDRAHDRVRGLNAGANDFLPKPYNLDELIARIRRLLSVKDPQYKAEGALLRYLGPAVRAQANCNPNLLAHRHINRAAVLFSDLRGFTHLSTRADLSSLTDLLNQFFTEMMAIVKQNGGLVIDLSGDELLAIFSSFDNLAVASHMAVRTAVKMQELFHELKGKWSVGGCQVGLGVGIHQGEVMEGNIGGEELIRYTVTGSVVNITHRLVELAKAGEIVISSELFDAAYPSLTDLKFVFSPPVRLKGIDEPQPIYRLCIPETKVSQRWGNEPAGILSTASAN